MAVPHRQGEDVRSRKAKREKEKKMKEERKESSKTERAWRVDGTGLGW